MERYWILPLPPHIRHGKESQKADRPLFSLSRQVVRDHLVQVPQRHSLQSLKGQARVQVPC